MDESEKSRQWAQKAIQSELKAISGIHGENPHKPSSEYWKCLVRLASVLKGAGKSHFQPSQVLTAVLRETPSDMHFKGNREKDIAYLFSRAYKLAHPRFPAQKWGGS